LGPNFRWIDTVRGVGYRFKLEEGDVSEEYVAEEELEEAIF
jgi:hypothetical protein